MVIQIKEHGPHNLFGSELDYGRENFDKDEGLATAHVLVQDVSKVLKLGVLLQTCLQCHMMLLNSLNNFFSFSWFYGASCTNLLYPHPSS